VTGIRGSGLRRSGARRTGPSRGPALRDLSMIVPMAPAGLRVLSSATEAVPQTITVAFSPMHGPFNSTGASTHRR